MRKNLLNHHSCTKHAGDRIIRCLSLLINLLSRMGFDFDALNEEEDSPYPEVRASVSNIDDPEMPAMTIRMWVIGLFLCILGRSVS